MTNTATRVLTHMLGFVSEDDLSPRAQQVLDEVRRFTFTDYGISSVDQAALLKKIGADFGIEIPADQAASWSSLDELTDFLDARS